MIKTGKPDIKQDTPSHTPGVNQGNSVGNYEKQAGHLPDGRRTDAASTGINPGKHGPIDPAMPSLSPP
ncbi:MAG: hypothetical protein QOG77_3548 [Solirubrobacteraceae bacterium]|nr:hypothetical protein [Solirubrobacteraceae bacterium]